MVIGFKALDAYLEYLKLWGESDAAVAKVIFPPDKDKSKHNKAMIDEINVDNN